MSNQQQTSTTALSGQVNVGDLTVCCGGCCTITSLFLSCPDCIGCANQCTICCIECEGVTCKIPKDDPTVCCIFNRNQCYCRKPQTCIRGTTQVFCLDSRCALPCTDDVPCVFTLLPACTCCAYYKMDVGCCRTIKSLKGYGSGGRVAAS